MLALGQAEVMPRDLGFGEWWAKYPRKVGRLAAEKAYRKTVEHGLATPTQLMAGLKNYCIYKPLDQPWCHPTTWLNQGRWSDLEPEQARDQRIEAPRMATPAPKPQQAIPAPARSDPTPDRWAMADRLKALASGLGKG